ncbi:secretion/DNA translocation related TadE-like protein [Arthrobacter sp. UYCu511]|uniref:Rv3654c family TadE-like protein n=2 Tax=unclassified Arthrobacter TaxID=235627 RepID=UPI00339A5558
MGEWLTMGGSERGAGTMLGAGIALAVLILLALLMGLATAAVAAGKAASAADLAALAAADAYRGLSSEVPCQVAADIAAANSAALVECLEMPESRSVQVKVLVRTTLPWPAQGQARAGPPPDTVRPLESGTKP